MEDAPWNAEITHQRGINMSDLTFKRRWVIGSDWHKREKSSELSMNSQYSHTWCFYFGISHPSVGVTHKESRAKATAKLDSQEERGSDTPTSCLSLAWRPHPHSPTSPSYLSTSCLREIQSGNEGRRRETTWGLMHVDSNSFLFSFHTSCIVTALIVLSVVVMCI